MEPGKTLYLTNRKDWRSWLRKNHDKEKEVWLIYYRKETGKPRISYEDAVEEALAYGWIDSIQKGLDKERFAQRFSPRRPASDLSELNRVRIRKLIAQKKMTLAGLKAVAHVYDPKEQGSTISLDVLKAFKEDEQAYRNFLNLPEDYKRIRLGFIESRRRHGKEAFKKSLKHFIEMTKKNKRFGMGR